MSWRLRDQPTGRRRLLQAGLAYAVVLLGLVALGLSPNALLLGAFFVVGLAVVAFFADRFLDSQGELWFPGNPSMTGLGRGSDHRTVALARRLANREKDASQRRNLAAEIQRQLQVVLADRVRRERGWDIIARPDLAYEALPGDLADLVARPPDPRLVEPEYLSALLDRIESP